MRDFLIIANSDIENSATWRQRYSRINIKCKQLLNGDGVYFSQTTSVFFTIQSRLLRHLPENETCEANYHAWRRINIGDRETALAD